MAAAMDVDTPSGTNNSIGKKRFEVKKWNAVALWAWDIVVDNCAICRNHIMDLSTEAVARTRLIPNEVTKRDTYRNCMPSPCGSALPGTVPYGWVSLLFVTV
uniref:Uncharacterized protein n=1 Tax=Leptobrachium leishanense TaxID=445787 RepID=A0A8C5QM79_9ANUR